MVKFIVDTVSSKRDSNGNCYHAVTITRLSDGATLQGAIDSPSNMRGYLLRCKAVEAGANEYHETNAEMPIRQFNRLVKGFIYLDEKAIAAFAKGEA